MLTHNLFMVANIPVVTLCLNLYSWTLKFLQGSKWQIWMEMETNSHFLHSSFLNLSVKPVIVIGLNLPKLSLKRKWHPFCVTLFTDSQWSISPSIQWKGSCYNATRSTFYTCGYCRDWCIFYYKYKQSITYSLCHLRNCLLFCSFWFRSCAVKYFKKISCLSSHPWMNVCLQPVKIRCWHHHWRSKH